MVRTVFIPSRGDVVWLTFDPQAGREQAGKRPALVLSPQAYNKITGLAIVCPITSRIKNYPFEVSIQGKKISGAILADHVKSADWKERNAKLIEKVSAAVLEEVLVK